MSYCAYISEMKNDENLWILSFNQCWNVSANKGTKMTTLWLLYAKSQSKIFKYQVQFSVGFETADSKVKQPEFESHTATRIQWHKVCKASM